MRNNYDIIAPWYDRLSRLVYGKAQVSAQTALLPYITTGNRILIVGGGSGFILEELARLHPSGLRITYVEISAKMVALSKQRNTGANEVEFVQKAIEDYQPVGMYDVIYTAFLFDNFKAAKAKAIFSFLHPYLIPNGKWLLADFQYAETKGRWWQRLLVNIMLVFFKVTCNIEASALVDMRPSFAAENYTILFSTVRYKAFIYSMVFQKP